jgi:hypothetical protein
MHVAWSSYAWFIFYLNTESHYLQIAYYSVYPSDNICSNPTPCFLLSFYLTYLENQLLCSWCEYPSTLVPGLLTTAHPLLVLPPFHTPQIKLQYLHRWHQQHQPSLSDTLKICVILRPKTWSRDLLWVHVCVHVHVHVHVHISVRVMQHGHEHKYEQNNKHRHETDLDVAMDMDILLHRYGHRHGHGFEHREWVIIGLSDIGLSTQTMVLSL